jgi:hypothetical protein
MTQTGSWYLGYYNADAPQLLNQAGATFNIANNWYISASTGSSLTNAGTLVKSGGSGTANIQASTTNTGTIAVNAGTLRFSGPSNSFAGTIRGAGVLEFSAGADTFAAGLTLSVASVLLSGATVTLGANVSDAAMWSQTGGTLALGGKTLTLSGQANLDGGTITGAGTVLATGASAITGLALEGSAVLKNTGTMVQSGSWYLGYYSSDNAQLVNQAGATFNIVNNADIYGSSGATLNNAGKLIKTNGNDVSSIAVATINSGAIEVGSGTMSFLSTVGGAGSFKADAGTTLQFGAAVSGGGTVTLESFADLFVQANAGFADTIAGFAAGNIIELTGFNFSGSSLAFNAATDQLRITSGTSNATLRFSGSYTASSFRLFSDQGLAAIAHT